MTNKITGVMTRFKQNPEGLYTFTLPELYQEMVWETKGHMNNLMVTVNKNCKGYMERQFEQAKQARALYHNVVMPTVKNFKALLCMNTIKNCLVMIEDVN